MNLKLNNIEKSNLSKREMAVVNGGAPGESCKCSCYYEKTGGSSDWDNAWANHATGSTSPIGGYAFIITTDGKVHDFRPYRP